MSRTHRIILLLLALMVLFILCYLLPRQTRPPEEIYAPRTIRVLFPDNKIREISLEAFLVGVVAAEAPASFHEAALSAQAVAARTYILRQSPPYGTGKHGEAAVCCDSTCCQAWLSEADLRARWGSSYAKNQAKISRAVYDTADEILLYDNACAQTYFFSCCGGCTEDAGAVWSSSLPYLQPVHCAFCASSPKASNVLSLSLTEASDLLACSEDDLQQMAVLSYTPGGRVDQLGLGGQTLSGTEMRSKLGLSSAAFSWLVLGDRIYFLNAGYGHGVGLCQYGANGMAEAGYTYQEILAFYYPGTELGKIE